MDVDVKQSHLISAFGALACGGQPVEFGIGSTVRLSRACLLSGCCVEPVEDKRRAPDLTGLEAPDPTVYADRGAMLVEIDDDALDAVQVPGAGLAIDANTVADVELVERLGRADRPQQVMTRLYRFCDRCEVRVELA